MQSTENLLNQVYIDEIYKKFIYAFENEQEFKDLILPIIEDYLEKASKTNKKISKYELKKYIENYIKEYIIKMSNDDSFKSLFIKRYIDNQISVDDLYENNLKTLNSFVNFLKLIKYSGSFDDYIEMLQDSQELNSIVNNIVNYNIELIKSNMIEKINSDDIFISIIEAYCSLNKFDLDIEENQKDLIQLIIDNDKLYDLGTDSLKWYTNQINEPLLTYEEERKLFLRVADGDKKARDEIIVRNLKLVLNIARKYKGNGMDYLDIIQYGNIGLIQAVDNFDVSLGYKFSSYATCIIRRYIYIGIIEGGRNIKLPYSVKCDVIKYRKCFEDLELKFGRTPTIEEIADKLNISLKRAIQLDKLQYDTISFYKKQDEDEEVDLNDVLSNDEDQELLLKDTILDELNKKIIELINNSNLTENEKYVIFHRYKLAGAKFETYKAIGAELNISKQRIKQIEITAFKKIRSNPKLREFLVYSEQPSKAEEFIKTFEKSRKRINKV